MFKTYDYDDQCEFKRQFVVNFLATWCASNYDDFCMRSKYKDLEQPPVEDAIHLAEKAWLHLGNITED